MKRYLLLMLPLALAACTQPATEQTTAPVEATAPAAPALDAASLSSHYWQLADAKAADGTRIDALFVQADKPVQLEFVEGRLAISNTCNRQSAGFTVDGDKLTISPAASTMMACPDGKKEKKFVTAYLGDAGMLRYNSKLPIVVYTPDNVDVKYRVWKAEEKIDNAVVR